MCGAQCQLLLRGFGEQTEQKVREGLLEEVMPGGSMALGTQLDSVAGTEVCGVWGQSRVWKDGQEPLH